MMSDLEIFIEISLKYTTKIMDLKISETLKVESFSRGIVIFKKK